MSDALPLFPLSTVLFPGIVMPLHIFEERYRLLVRDLVALPPDAAREFGVVAIKVGYEVGERGVQTIQRTGCAALVTEVTVNPDGTLEIMVVGRRRFHVDSLDASKDYLKAEVSWLPDDEDEEPLPEAQVTAELAKAMFGEYRRRIERLRGEDVLEGATPEDPVDLSYTLAAALVLSLADRQRMLEAADVVSRLRLGVALMRSELRAMTAIASLPATSLARTQWCPN